MAEHTVKAFPWFFHVLHAVEKAYARFSLHPEWAVYPSADFPWTQKLEQASDDIRAELESILSRRDPIPNFQEVSPEQVAITSGDRWKTFILYAYGVKAMRNCGECPKTTAALEAIPGLKTAFFSILCGGSHIPAHRGPYKGVLRCHLGLIVPEGCRIRIGDGIHEWHEGKALIFDDTYVHEVWNDSQADRVVLFIDFARPMRLPLALLNEVVMWAIVKSPYGRSYIKRFFKWYESRGIKADI